MRYSSLIDVYEKIEATTKRLEMTDHLVNLFKNTPKDILDRVVYLTQGKLYPDFVDLELGIAEKMAMRAISMAFGIPQKNVLEDLRERGDLGLTAENLASKKVQATLFAKPLMVGEVYDVLDKIAKAAGAGSQDLKMKLLAGLLSDAKPKEAKYIIRMVTGNLRLGIADMSILDALAISFTGSKENRGKIERAYNLSSDLGDVAKTLAEKGLRGIREYRVKIGRPIRMMMAQRLATANEILEKLGGKAACEWKYDGERIQIHKEGEKITLFTRRLENITSQYPDAVSLANENIKIKEAIIEGEAVATDPSTGDLLPFQLLMHRRRKYGIKKAAEEFPVNLFIFDALYLDGKDMTQRPYLERREALKNVIKETERFKLAEALVTDNPREVEKFFEKSIAAGCEGLILKSEKGIYQAGARGWLWIKLKKSYESKMIEPIDAVIVGAFSGRGKRSGTYGALLASVYDKKKDVFVTICKVGSGFSDEDLGKLPAILSPSKIDHVHPRVVSELEADVWFTPKMVIEIIGDELTLSPVHTCAYGVLKEGAGIAIRFPRFTGSWRLDKSPEDATTVEEIMDMYKGQLKKI